MFDLRDDGSIGIDFSIPPEGDGEATTKTIVVQSPPTFGAYKRLRAEVDSINKRFSDLSTSLREDDAVSVAQMQSQLQSAIEDGALEWWAFVMKGDESFKGLGSDVPPDVESWPVYLTSNESVTAALGHWKSVPLARSGKLQPKTT